MKKLLLITLAIFSAIGSIMAQGITFSAPCPSGQTINFKIIDGERLYVEVASDNDVTGVIEIPDIVTYNHRDFTVTQIGNNAFRPSNSTHYGPRTVTLPNTIKTIDSYAFEDCRNLMEINMPNSIDSIYPYAFYGCRKLTSITIPSSVKFLGEFLFESCEHLTTIHYDAIDCTHASYSFYSDFTNLILSDSVRRIPDQAFISTGITGPLVLPSSVKYVGQGAFHNCDKITSVYIPHNIDTIMESFSLCSNIDTVFYDAIHAVTPDYYAGAFCSSSVKTVVFGNQVEILPFDIFADCINIDTLVLPNSLRRIEDYAFYRCSSLVGLTIPQNVEYIGNLAFYGCSNITSMNLKPITPPEILQNAFYEFPTDIPITIPCHSDYPNAPYWNYFTNFIEDCSAVDENEVEENAIVYPNPVHDELHIDGKDLVRIEIVNSIGQILETFACDKEETTIDMSQYQPGLYLIRMIGEGSVSKQIIKL